MRKSRQTFYSLSIYFRYLSDINLTLTGNIEINIDKMVFEKNFKNYINHKEQFAEKARRRREAIIQKRKKQAQIDDADDYFNEDEILSNTGSDYQYRDADDMKIAYDTIATGKRRKKGVQLFHAEKFQFAFKFA